MKPTFWKTKNRGKLIYSMAEYRTIEQAKQVEIPSFPVHFAEDYLALTKAFQTEQQSTEDKIRKLYAFTDKLTAFVSPYMVCAKGCAYCCKKNGIHVRTVEAQYIRNSLGLALNSDPAIISGQADLKKPCPFLDANNDCAIYPYRPFKCRTAFTLDNPVFCDSETVHTIYTSNSNRMLTELLNMIDQINENQPIRDIRNFFSEEKT